MPSSSREGRTHNPFRRVQYNYWSKQTSQKRRGLRPLHPVCDSPHNIQRCLRPLSWKPGRCLLKKSNMRAKREQRKDAPETKQTFIPTMRSLVESYAKASACLRRLSSAEKNSSFLALTCAFACRISSEIS